MYVYNTKEGYEEVKKKAICQRCFSDDIRLINGKYICCHCNTDYEEEKDE